VAERDAAGPEAVERQLASSASEVVEGRDVDARDVALEEERQGRSDEPGAARDEALHAPKVHHSAAIGLSGYWVIGLLRLG